MNRRKAKKIVKRVHGIARWPGNMSPREVDAFCCFIKREFNKELFDALENAILYGASGPGRETNPGGLDFLLPEVLIDAIHSP